MNSALASRHPFQRAVGQLPVEIAITPDGKAAYVLAMFAGTVTPIATATDTPGKPIKVGRIPSAIAITP
ncbi:MAG TPA: hypothetical protein VK162_14255 [Streptosporangiaceae bacterium]|nr:hypothetical protein [Streptosporangiaceae bacterium]